MTLFTENYKDGDPEYDRMNIEWKTEYQLENSLKWEVRHIMYVDGNRTDCVIYQYSTGFRTDKKSPLSSVETLIMLKSKFERDYKLKILENEDKLESYDYSWSN